MNRSTFITSLLALPATAKALMELEPKRELRYPKIQYETIGSNVIMTRTDSDKRDMVVYTADGLYEVFDEGFVTSDRILNLKIIRRVLKVKVAFIENGKIGQRSGAFYIPSGGEYEFRGAI